MATAKNDWSKTPPAAFNLQEQMGLAVEWLIQDLKERQSEGGYRSDVNYFTATDLERRVRAAATEIMDGREYGSLDTNIYTSVRIRGLGRRTLLDHCRGFLTQQVRTGRLRADHPGQRRTISGLRFRPADWGLTAAEQKVAETPLEEKRRKAWITHWKLTFVPEESGKAWVGAACQAHKAGKKKTYRSYSGWRRHGRGTTPQDDVSKVTCKKCLGLAAKRAGLRADAPPQMIQDRLIELDGK